MKPLSAPRVAVFVTAIGGLLILGSTLFAAAFSALALLFALWALLPYGLLLIVSRLSANTAAMAGAGAAVLAGEIGFRLAVFIFPSGSTAGIALLFSPVFLTILAFPAGWMGGWGLGRIWRSSRTLAGIGALLFSIGLYLFALSLARPDLTPWAIQERDRWQNLLGDPRIVEQSKGWTREKVSDRSGWVQTYDFDGIEGDEIAIVNHQTVLFLDPTTFEALDELAHGAPKGWNWFSRLARFDEGPVIVQTGGGYQETEVLELDGRPRWRYRPQKDLPPSALRPWELDGDGRMDLVAIDGTRLVRLDQGGQEVWESQIPYGTNLLLAPLVPELSPAWIVTWGQLESRVWAHDGQQLGVLDLPGCQVRAVVDLAQGRRLICGTDSLSAFDLEGRRAFEISLDELSPTQVAAARLEADAPPYLVVITTAPKDVERWRIAVHEPGHDHLYQTRVYEEITDRPPGLLIARRKDGTDLLLLKFSGSELWVLRPS